MDLKQLEYIIAISDYGNITAAAEHLYVTPSALDQQLIKRVIVLAAGALLVIAACVAIMYML